MELSFTSWSRMSSRVEPNQYLWHKRMAIRDENRFAFLKKNIQVKLHVGWDFSGFLNVKEL